jgi:hypothetical protein
MFRIHIRNILYTCSLLSISFPLLSQSRLDTEFSMRLGKAVSISAGPDQLRVVDPASQESTAMELPSAPRRFALSADGRYAAVAFDGSIAYIDLERMSVERSYETSGPVSEIALTADRIEINVGEGMVRSIRLSDGEMSEPSIRVEGLRKEVTPQMDAYVLESDPKGKIQQRAAVGGRAAGGPSIVSGTPTSPTGSPQTFTFTASDPDGFGDIGRFYFLINVNTGIPANTCHGFYDRASDMKRPVNTFHRC